MSIVNMIITDVLTALYEPFWFSVLAAVLFMFFWLYAKEHGWKGAVKGWLTAFRQTSQFRRILLLAFFTVMILMKTLLNRNMWANPFCNVMGGWTLYDIEGNLTAESIENVMLLVPFTALLLWSFSKELKLEKEAESVQEQKNLPHRLSLKRVIGASMRCAFLFSLTIELLQLLLRLGTFQIADLFYNTAGGILGGFCYYLGNFWRRRIK